MWTPLRRFDYPSRRATVHPEGARTDMINSIRIQDFKGHRDTVVRLGRLTVLVGPNGSGKTSVLEALRLERQLWYEPPPFHGTRIPFDDLLRRGGSATFNIISGGTSAKAEWTSILHVAGGGSYAGTFKRGNRTDTISFVDSTLKQGNPHGLSKEMQVLGRAALFKFNAENIAAAAYSDQPGANVAYDGTNTAVALAELKLGYDEIFARIEEEMRAIVPSVERVRIRQATVSRPGLQDVVGSKIYFDFRGAPGVPAHCASEGTLITLALLTVLHGPSRPNLILLDDFDQSLHPQAQMELVTLIKRLLDEFTDLQIVATTHSPYILDQLEPSDVHVFALRDDGTVATRPLSEHPEATKMKGALTTGQIWTLDQERSWVLEGQTA